MSASAGKVVIADEPADGADARDCAAAYYAELAERFEEGFDPGSAAYAGAPPGASDDFVLIARLEGKPVGCGTLRSLGQGIGEIKRVWTSRTARGRGIAAAIMDRLEEEARRRGYGSLRLDTNRALTEAQAFYLKRGYRAIAAYNDNPYADHWYELRLADQPASTSRPGR